MNILKEILLELKEIKKVLQTIASSLEKDEVNDYSTKLRQRDTEKVLKISLKINDKVIFESERIIY